VLLTVSPDSGNKQGGRYLQLADLLERNKHWSKKITDINPTFFSDLAREQKPSILWLGCSDSRAPAIEVVDLMPGSIFVHRNIANLIVHTDLNCLSVIQYAIDILNIKDIIVCGHYGCGGIKAAMDGKEHGLIDNWLRHIKDIYRYHHKSLDAEKDFRKRWNMLSELNVIEQVNNVCHTTIVQKRWSDGGKLNVHGWIYDIESGLLKDLGVSISVVDGISRHHRLE